MQTTTRLPTAWVRAAALLVLSTSIPSYARADAPKAPVRHGEGELVLRVERPPETMAFFSFPRHELLRLRLTPGPSGRVSAHVERWSALGFSASAQVTWRPPTRGSAQLALQQTQGAFTSSLQAGLRTEQAGWVGSGTFRRLYAGTQHRRHSLPEKVTLRGFLVPSMPDRAVCGGPRERTLTLTVIARWEGISDVITPGKVNPCLISPWFAPVTWPKTITLATEILGDGASTSSADVAFRFSPREAWPLSSTLTFKRRCVVTAQVVGPAVVVDGRRIRTTVQLHDLDLAGGAPAKATVQVFHVKGNRLFGCRSTFHVTSAATAPR
jgi:hypothetical protein